MILTCDPLLFSRQTGSSRGFQDDRSDRELSRSFVAGTTWQWRKWGHLVHRGATWRHQAAMGQGRQNAWPWPYRLWPYRRSILYVPGGGREWDGHGRVCGAAQSCGAQEWTWYVVERIYGNKVNVNERTTMTSSMNDVKHVCKSDICVWKNESLTEFSQMLLGGRICASRFQHVVVPCSFWNFQLNQFHHERKQLHRHTDGIYKLTNNC